MKATSLFLLGLAVILLITAAQAEDIAGPFSMTSTSPTNSFLTGSKAIYEELLARGYNVILGGIGHAKYYDNVLYLIIGPEKPFTPLEVALIKELVDSGKLSVIIADETGISNDLVIELVNASISGSYLQHSAIASERYLVSLECMDRGIISSKVSYIYTYVQPPGYRVVCEAADFSYPIGIVSGMQGRVMVIADSSIFANFLVNGYNGIPSTRAVALELIESMIQDPKRTMVVFDIEHYNESFRVNVGAIVSTLIYSFSFLLDSIGDELGKGELLLAALGLLLAPLLSSFMMLKPKVALTKRGTGLEDLVWGYVEEEAGFILGDRYRKRPVVDRLFDRKARLYRALYRLTGDRDG